MGAARLAEPFYYGGQAVLEGVMMRGRRVYAVAVRAPGRDIQVLEQPSVPWARRFRPLRWPLLRGAVAMAEALVIGYRALNESAAQLMEDGEPAGRKSGWTRAVEWLSPVLGVGLAIVLFVLVPAAAVRWAQSWIGQPALLNLFEGLIKAVLFVGYIGVIGMWREMARVFQYHGAEHKAINCYEAGEPLSVETVRRHSRIHPRCGTNFLFLVVLVSVVVFSVVTAVNGRPPFLQRVLVHLAILPLVAGVAYELIRAAARKDAPGLARLISRPGMWLQYLTTREPDDSQIEVAIAALSAVLRHDHAEPEPTSSGARSEPLPVR